MANENRSVKISLFLQASNYVQGQLEATRATNKTRDAVAQAAAKMQAQREVMETTGKSALFFGTLVAAGIAVAVKKYAEFDQAMSNVIATGEDARANQDALRQAALDAGAATVFSATQAANAIEELAKAGVSARDILAGGLDASLNLAAASNLEVADAAGIAATAMQQFNLRGEDMGHVSDLLAAGAGKAMGEVSDLSAALGQAGLVANATGLSIEETTAGLSAFAAAGLLGSDAGTSFKAMLQRLTPQSAEAEGEMKRLGISAYDAQGNFIGLAEFAGNLQGALQKLTPEQRNAALATIFGSDAVRAANILYAEGESGIRDWTAAVDDQGYAAETARTKLDNLKGDLEALGGAFDTALIQGGSAANDTLRAMVQIITELVTGYSELPEPVQATIMAVGGVTAAVALAGGTALVAVPKFAQFRAAVALSGVSLTRTALTAGAAGLALGGLFAIIGTMAARAAEMRAGSSEFADSLDDLTGAVTSNTRAMIAKKLADQDAFKGAKDAGIGQKELVDALYEGGDAVEVLRKRMYDFANGNPFNPNIANSVNALNELDSQLAGAKDRHDDLKASQEENSDGSKSAAAAYLEAASGAEELTDQVSTLIEEINKANGVGQDAVSANIAYRDALAGVDDVIQKARDGVEGYALTLDQNTQAGRDNMGMLNDLAGDYQAAAAAQFALDGNTESYVANLQAGRDAVLQRARDLGATDEQIQYLSDHITAMPTEKQIQITADTISAARTIDDFMSIYGNLVGRIMYRATLPDLNGDVSGSGRPGFAAGGAVRGPGTSTSDSIPALLSNDEHVWTAAEVRNAGGHARMYEMRAMFAAGRVAGYANGGIVQPRYASNWGGGGGGGGRQSVGTHVDAKFDIHTAPGMSEEQVARISAEKMAFTLRGA